MHKDYKEQIGSNFSTPKEIAEFVNDGLDILDFFLERRQMHFTKRGTRLLGVERQQWTLTAWTPTEDLLLYI